MDGKLDDVESIRGIIARRVPAVASKLESADMPLGLNGVGLDSVQLAEILMMIESEMGVAIPDEWEPAGEITINALASLVTDLRASRGEQ